MPASDRDLGSPAPSNYSKNLGDLARSVALENPRDNPNELEELDSFINKDLNTEKLEACLKLNRNLQNSLKARLEAICRAKKQNEEQKEPAPLINTGDTSEDLFLKTHSNFVFVPYFIDRRGYVPIDNRDTLLRQQIPPLCKSYAIWTVNDRRSLATAIKADNLRILHERKNQVPGRTGRECSIRWTCYDHPAINKKKWTPEEEEQLLEISKAFNYRNWPSIAAHMKSNRTAIQCFKQYLSHKHSLPSRMRWTKKEDGILLEAIRIYGERNWKQIALCFDNRNGASCLHRWRNALRQTIKRDKWTKEEDEALRKAVAQMGEGNWTQIFPFIRGRSDVQCRERWMNVLRPDLDHTAWSPYMDAILCRLVNTHGLGKWSLLASKIKGRTDNQIWRRWKTLVNCGAANSQNITHPDFLNSNPKPLISHRLVSTKPGPCPSTESLQNHTSARKRYRKLVERHPPFETKPRRPIGGGVNNYSASLPHFD
ncbi:hypothetical protein L0F63_005077 [Massospora cicadina]|nr:hypothetical protein L0F63_005077 [Massospora cicadina]